MTLPTNLRMHPTKVMPLCVLVGITTSLSMSLSAQQTWKPAAAPLLTRWAKDVRAANPRPEYPRPSAVRKEWQSLNGLWEFAFDDAAKGRESGWQSGHPLPERILVPFTFESALSGIGKGKEIHEHIWYRRTFDVPKGWRDRRILLHFGACDWETTVWVNGKEVGQHRGGYTPFTLDVTNALKPTGTQEVVLSVYDPADPKKGAYQPKGKQLGSESIWYTRTTGIWQTVWLEPVSGEYIREFALEADPKSGNVTIRPTLSVSDEVTFAVTVRHGATKVSGESSGGKPITVQVPAPALWSPESPTLYDVSLTLTKNKRVTDHLDTYCAFRTVGMANGRITLNGKPYFLRGVLDQGFWPDGIYTPPTDEALKNEVVITKELGFNLARKHVKVEDPRWYYYCDKLGLLVAQDMPSSHNLVTDEAKKNFTAEWRDVMAAVRFHPSIILWIPFNENWGDPKAFQDDVVDMTRATDPSRPIIDASGWTQRDKTDITDIHDYGNDLKKHALASPPRPRWIGEYGGVALPITGHTWVSGWGYQTVKTPEDLLQKYQFLTDQINEASGLSGFVYTQLTDVEQELNGLLTYDRLPKISPKALADINQKKKRVTRR